MCGGESFRVIRAGVVFGIIVCFFSMRASFTMRNSGTVQGGGLGVT